MSIRSEYFFYTSSSWMHWSMLSQNWENGEESSGKNSPKTATLSAGNLLKVSLGYICGSIGHVLTLVTKVISIALFFFLTIGCGLHLAFSKMMRCKREKTIENQTFRFQMSLIIFLDSFVATTIDSVGVICPIIAYKIHNSLLKKLPIFIKMAIPKKEMPLYDATHCFRIFLNPSKLKNEI